MNERRPHIICHMITSLDGRIDTSAFRSVASMSHYEETGAMLEGDAWICGRTTMEHFAEDGSFHASGGPVGETVVHVARQAGSHAIVVDTVGTLSWNRNEIDGDHLVCLVSERVPTDYLEVLRDREISYVVVGSPRADLVRGVELLREHFGITRLLLEGGGHINGAFYDAGLVDEVSLLIVPSIDGRLGVPAAFDGLGPTRKGATPYRLMSVEHRDEDVLWVRYSASRD